jgi:anthranilate phosphoribosyltransferase
MIREAIDQAVGRVDLPEEEMMAAMEEIMNGDATPAQVGSLITALRMKGETVEEVTGAARIMRQKAARVNACARTVVDTCGTGGDKLGTFNISRRRALSWRRRASSSPARQPRRLQRLRQRRRSRSLGVNISVDQEIVEECPESASAFSSRRNCTAR